MLILDGWDEISVSASAGYQQRVERMLEAVRQKFLSRRAIPVRVVLTGRPSLAIEESKFLHRETRLLTIRNFSPFQLAGYVEKVKKATSGARTKAAWDLSKVTALPRVLEEYRQDFEQKDDQRERKGSLEIFGLPLLAHLALRLLGERPENASELLRNTASLYRSLVDLVVGHAGKPQEADFEGSAVLKGQELRELLRGTAEAMTTFGAEAIPYEELAARLDLDDAELLRRVDNLSGEQVLSRLMISFFFKGGRTELGVEFSHKSFREYLFAEQLVEVLKSYGRKAPDFLPERPAEYFWKDFDTSDPRLAFCHRLAEMLGPAWLSYEVALHVTQILEWEISRSADWDLVSEIERAAILSGPEWRRVRDGLADAWDWWGEGVHLRAQPARVTGGYWRYEEKPLALRVAESMRLRSDEKKCPLPRRMNTVDAHLGDGLFHLAAALHGELYFASKPGFRPRPLDLGENRLRRYQFQAGEKPMVFAPSGPEANNFFGYCARINSGEYRPSGRFPSNARAFGVYLGGTDLRALDFNGAWLEGANFNEADLTRAHFSEAFLLGSTFLNTILFGADFSRAALAGADLRSANLGRADLQDAELSNADLNGANLAEANLGETVLQDANLSGADLEGTRLEGADLRGANLQGTDLSLAFLSGARFSISDLEGAIYDREQLEFAVVEDDA